MSIMIQVPEYDNIDWKGWGDRELSELGDYYAEDIKADRIYYIYYTGCYEGGGTATLLVNGKRYNTSLGHCSCYGPFEYFKTDTNTAFDTIQQALNASSFTEQQQQFILKDYL